MPVGYLKYFFKKEMLERWRKKVHNVHITHSLAIFRARHEQGTGIMASRHFFKNSSRSMFVTVCRFPCIIACHLILVVKVKTIEWTNTLIRSNWKRWKKPIHLKCSKNKECCNWTSPATCFSLSFLNEDKSSKAMERPLTPNLDQMAGLWFNCFKLKQKSL